MVRKSRARSSSLFLMELILAIFFFSAASAVCVQFFVKSHLLGRDSNALNQAVIECSGIAEAISTAGSLAESVALLQTLYPGSDFQDGVSDTSSDAELSFYYDDEFAVCRKADASYILSLHLSQSDRMLNAFMLVIDVSPEADTESVYSLDAKHHIPRRTDYEKR